MTLPPTWYRVDRHIAARKDLLELDAQTGLVHTLTRTLRRSVPPVPLATVNSASALRCPLAPASRPCARWGAQVPRRTRHDSSPEVPHRAGLVWTGAAQMSARPQASRASPTLDRSALGATAFAFGESLNAQRFPGRGIGRDVPTLGDGWQSA